MIAPVRFRYSDSTPAMPLADVAAGAERPCADMSSAAERERQERAQTQPKSTPAPTSLV